MNKELAFFLHVTAVLVIVAKLVAGLSDEMAMAADALVLMLLLAALFVQYRVGDGRTPPPPLTAD